MITCTVLLVFLLLVLAPIRLLVGAEVCPSDVSLKVHVRTRLLRVFEERFSLQDGMIVCSGTIKDCLRIADLDFDGGLDLTKCITLDRLDVGFCPNLCGSPVETTAYNLLAAFVGIAALFTHIQLYVTSMPSYGQSKVCAAAKVSSNLAEILAYVARHMFATKK